MVQYLIHSAATDNSHAAGFPAGSTIPAVRFMPTDQQVNAMAEAAQQASMDAHQVAFLAEAMYRDPATLGIIPTRPDEAIREVAQSPITLPEPNHSCLVHRLQNTS